MSKYNVSVEGVSVEAVFNKLGGVEGSKLLLSDELVVVPKAPRASELLLDFTVRVDRSFVVLPSWADPSWLTQEFMGLQTTGPAEYNLRDDVEQWLHPDQPSVVRGDAIYKALKHDNALTDQLGPADLLAIQAKGIAVFRKLFAGKAVFGWKSVVRSRVNRSLYVPYLYESGDKVVLDWFWLGNGWFSCDPALRFRK